jgi:HlyD family secretion protein
MRLPTRTRGSRYYRAEMELNPGEMEKLGDVTLIPGMPVETFIKTDERTPLAYLLKPFTDYFNRAFRET